MALATRQTHGRCPFPLQKHLSPVHPPFLVPPKAVVELESSWIVSDFDGSHQHVVALSDKAVTWYPLGTALVIDDSNGHLQIVDAMTGVVEKTFNYPAAPNQLISPDWSPDGRYVILTQLFTPGLPRHVVVLDTTNDKVRQIDTVPGFYEDMSWSPNSRYLVVSAQLNLPAMGSPNNLYILGVEDKSMVPLLSGAVYVSAPDWSNPTSP